MIDVSHLSLFLLCTQVGESDVAKCEFGKATVTYLGKQVCQEQVSLLEDKLQSFPSNEQSHCAIFWKCVLIPVNRLLLLLSLSQT